MPTPSPRSCGTWTTRLPILPSFRCTSSPRKLANTSRLFSPVKVLTSSLVATPSIRSHCLLLLLKRFRPHCVKVSVSFPESCPPPGGVSPCSSVPHCQWNGDTTPPPGGPIPGH